MTEVSPRLAAEIDSVYFLTFGGWNSELRANRWHYASRWGRSLPVVLVEPSNSRRTLPVQLDPRIPNMRVLRMNSARGGFAPRGHASSVSTLLRYMKEKGHRRPLLWAYNPAFLGAFVTLPAAARVYHATENYYAFDGLPPSFMRPLEAMLEASDLVVAVSAGVAA